MLYGILTSLKRHADAVMLITGSLIVSVWTMLRFFDQKTIFDLVGQQVLAHQWLHGDMAGSTVGPTNYILKILFIYIPADLLPGSPRLKLILTALLINIVTFILLCLLLKRILAFFTDHRGSLSTYAPLWLAVLAGSVFWIQFSNSRNLEVVGGLWMIERCLTFMRRPTWKLGLVITGLTAVLFFADSLQIYMTAIPVIIYLLVLVAAKRERLRIVLFLASTLLAGLFISKLLLLVAGQLTAVHFLDGGNNPIAWNLGTVLQGLRGTAIGFTHLFSGASDAGRLREAVNLIFVAVLAIYFVYASIRRYVPRKLTLFVGVFMAIDALIFLISGQALIESTSRYLIMTATVAVLALAGTADALDAKPRSKPLAASIFITVLIVNVVAIGLGTVKHWDTRFPLDNHLYSVSRFTGAQGYRVVYASMDTAIPLSYLRDNQTTSYIPVACVGDTIYRNDLFFDRSVERRALSNQPATVAVVLDGAAISNKPYSCTVNDIIRQLGAPEQRLRSDDDSTILVFDRKAINTIPWIPR